jgi:hypothetical protein
VLIKVERYAPLVLMLSCGGAVAGPADGGARGAQSNDAGAECSGCFNADALPPVEVLNAQPSVPSPGEAPQ